MDTNYEKDQQGSNICPLCGNDNLCGVLSSDTGNTNCWCFDRDIEFPAPLIDKLSDQDKNKACICQSCLVHFNLDSDLITEVK